MTRRTAAQVRPSPTPQERDRIRTYLTARSGYHRAEAVAVLLLKLVFLALAGAFAWLAAISATSEHLVTWERVVLVALCVVVGVLVLRYMFRVGYGFAVLADRLGPSGRFARLRGQGTAVGPETSASAPESASSGDDVLRASWHGQGALFSRAVLFVLLGIPAIVLVGYVVLSYLAPLWGRVRYGPIADGPSWNEPEYFTDLGGTFFESEWIAWTVLAMIFSGALLAMGIGLGYLAVPLLTRSGADALDLAVVADGVIVRGGLWIGWREIAEVLVVEDVRTRGNPARIAGHSRTRVAVVLRDLPDVAARTDRARCRALRVSRDGLSGYALCDLWCHDPDVVADAVARLENAARRARVVLETRRVTRGDSPLWASRYLV